MESKMSGVVRTAGVEKDEHGKEIFRVIVDYRDAPPGDMTFGWIWESLAVEIVLAGAAAACQPPPERKAE